jgi:methionyl-tRNA synthetase
MLPLIPAGHALNPAEILFEKISDELVTEEKAKLTPTTTPNNPFPAMKDLIQFDDFTKMDIRTGTIIEAERVPKTDKLLKLKINTGIDERTIVSGIAQYYAPEDIIGQKICMLVNLAPRKIKGIESQGMILMAENSKGELCFMTPTKDFNNGSLVK